MKIKGAMLLGTILCLNIYGIYVAMNNYSYGLRNVSFLLWIFLLDCPLAVFLFILSIWEREWGGFAFVALIKYSLWTFLAYLFYWSKFVNTDTLYEALLLLFGHLGMIVEAILFGFQKVNKKYVFLLIIFFLTNDIIDYFYLMDYVLPNEGYYLQLFAYNILSTILLSIFVYKYEIKRNKIIDELISA